MAYVSYASFNGKERKRAQSFRFEGIGSMVYCCCWIHFIPPFLHPFFSLPSYSPVLHSLPAPHTADLPSAAGFDRAAEELLCVVATCVKWPQKSAVDAVGSHFITVQITFTVIICCAWQNSPATGLLDCKPVGRALKLPIAII